MTIMPAQPYLSVFQRRALFVVALAAASYQAYKDLTRVELDSKIDSLSVKAIALSSNLLIVSNTKLFFERAMIVPDLKSRIILIVAFVIVFTHRLYLSYDLTTQTAPITLENEALQSYLVCASSVVVGTFFRVIFENISAKRP